MGTRGCYGFHRDGEDKLTYNHYDSYPEGLGNDIVSFIESTSIEDMNRLFDGIILVEQGSKPTPEQIEQAKEYSDTSVSTGSLDEWYVLLRDTQGDLAAHWKVPFMIDNKDFMKDSLFCEWAYVINLSTNELEVYKGFELAPQFDKPNRYNVFKVDKQPPRPLEDKYYNCHLLITFPLKDIPKDWKQIVADLAEVRYETQEQRAKEYKEMMDEAERIGDLYPFVKGD